ncbi:outer membrane protein [Bradyrhizobium iriomotense]|uniref:Outer-membrane immunogenic protein n=1 Tax=Bradyrhizobium iriomotense TaxID=441950 RepID=A0ABQ6AZU8_9BRAD|nr:outer membrane protein [Bradyrhizobium iriomotense]GLR85427.1 outer-membrane immunogenic protein [Bradyrhizobium iriomotense]
MKRMAIGVATVISLLATSAMAADLTAPKPYVKAPPVVATVYSWTGFYVGGNIGYGWGRSRNSETISNLATGAALFTNTSSNDVNGVIGGGQVGYNWQVQNWVFGIEADIQGSDQKGSSNLVCVGCANDGSDITSTLTQKLSWFGTVRGRAGVLVTPNVLLYGTGGLAYGEFKTGGSITGNGVGGVPVTVVFPGASSTQVGWTVGAGVEGKIGGNWTAKLEYLYMDLGSVSAGPIATTILVPRRTDAGVSYSSAFRDNILRVGVNYQFGGGPVVAKY